MNVRLFSTLGLVVFAGAWSVAGCSSSDDTSSAQGGSTAKGGTSGAGAGGAHAGAGGGAQAGSGGATSGGATSGGSGGVNSSGGTGGANGGTGGAAAGTGGVTGGTGGASGGTGGATAGTGGASGGTGGATAGTGGAIGQAGDLGTAGEAGAPASTPCGGCAVLKAPLAAHGDQASAQIVFNATDLTGVTITLRTCVVIGDATSALQVYVQNGAAQSYAGDFGQQYKTFNNVSKCSDGMQDLTLNVVSGGSFDASAVTSLTVQVLTDGTDGPWSTSIIDIDSITATGDAIGPWTFTSNASAFSLQGGAVAGSTLRWMP